MNISKDRVKEELEKLQSESASHFFEIKMRDQSELGALSTREYKLASLMSTYDRNQFNEFSASMESDLWLQLTSDSVPTMMEDRNCWSLKPNVRKTVWQNFESGQEALLLLGTLPKSKNLLFEDMLAKYLGGNAPPINSLSREQLSITLQLCEMLPSELAVMPSIDVVRSALERKRLVEPFEKLTGDYFVGRKKELSILEDYVGVLPSTSVFRNLSKGVKKLFKLYKEPPLVVHGPGGMGKSTLIAQFLLNHANLKEIAFAYLDFDRAVLLAERPLTLLMEIVRQLKMQSERDVEIDTLLDTWSDRLISSTQDDVSIAVTEFNDKMVDALAEGKRLLLIFDTFEEVQYKSKAFIVNLRKFLELLQQTMPSLRVVIAGRSPVVQFHTRSLQLTELDQQSAISYLTKRSVEPTVAADLVRDIGGNPLSLRLAVDLFAVDERSSFREIIERQVNLAFGKLNSEIAQGYLYTRLLRHIHDPALRTLAHPGLLLRIITPSIIKDVLAGPCGLSVISDSEAQQLFDGLAEETTLVTMVEGKRLKHRSDVRKVMLRLMTNDPKISLEVRERIHQRAVAYYEQFEDPESRAEEIYHRLWLHQGHEELTARWQNGIEKYLFNAIDELPQEASRILASKLGIDLADEDRVASDQVSWEMMVEKLANDSLRIEDAAQALSLLSERDERLPGSPLYDVEASALILLGRLSEARKCLEGSLESLSIDTDSGHWLSVMLRLTKLDITIGDIQSAKDRLDSGLSFLSKSRNQIDLEFAEWFLLGSLICLDLGEKEVSEFFRDQLVKCLSERDQSRLVPANLLNLTAKVLGSEEPRLIEQAIQQPESPLTQIALESLELLGKSAWSCGLVHSNFDSEPNNRTDYRAKLNKELRLIDLVLNWESPLTRAFAKLLREFIPASVIEDRGLVPKYIESHKVEFIEHENPPLKLNALADLFESKLVSERLTEFGRTMLGWTGSASSPENLLTSFRDAGLLSAALVALRLYRPSDSEVYNQCRAVFGDLATLNLEFGPLIRSPFQIMYCNELKILGALIGPDKLLLPNIDQIIGGNERFHVHFPYEERAMRFGLPIDTMNLEIGRDSVCASANEWMVFDLPTPVGFYPPGVRASILGAEQRGWFSTGVGSSTSYCIEYVKDELRLLPAEEANKSPGVLVDRFGLVTGFSFGGIKHFTTEEIQLFNRFSTPQNGYKLT